MSPGSSRYARQEILPGIGVEGQARIRGGHVVVVGLGALGCVVVDLLARAGVGRLTLIDRDVVEWTNLQRQTLYTEQDARAGVPKAEACAARVAAINSGVACDARSADVTGENVEGLAGLRGGGRPGALVDATDNLESRFLLNDVAVKHGVPLVYGGVVGTRGMHAVFTARVGGGLPCLRCVFGGPGAPGSAPTCDTAGVLGSAVAAVGAAQAAGVLRLLVGGVGGVGGELTELDAWSGHHRVIALGAADPGCVCCGAGVFEFLGAGAADAVVLCGQHAVQVRPAGTGGVDMDALAARLARVGEVQRTRFMVRFTPGELRGAFLSVFEDGRAIVHGTDRPEVARAWYSRYIG